MLVLTRKEGQGFLLGDSVEITLLEISGDKIRIAIKAPRDVRILRKELAEAQASNREALMEGSSLDLRDLSQLKSVLSQGRLATPVRPENGPPPKPTEE